MKGLGLIDEVKEILIYTSFNIVHRNMADSADPDETPHFAASHLGALFVNTHLFHFFA